jgi:hypothetical protein
MTPEQDLQSRLEADPRPCANCEHDAHIGPCEYELGDRWVTGNQASAPTVLMAMPPCGCTHYEPMTAEDILSAENEGL